MQALHIQCRQPPTPGEPFYPDANAIFNETLIAGPSAPSNNNGDSGGLHGTSLALAIALPVVGGILLLSLGCWGCWIVTRRRRRRMAASGRMSRVVEHHAQRESGQYSPELQSHTPSKAWGAVEPATEMSQLPGQYHDQHQYHADHDGANAASSSDHSTAAATAYRQPSPRFASFSNRFSNSHSHSNSPSYPPGMVLTGEDGTPLRSSFQHDDVGPGADQVQDHDLHEQYFGVADGGPDAPVHQYHQYGGGGQGYEGEVGQRHAGSGSAAQGGIREDERGHFVQ
jgi:hypothetical protein